MTNTELLEVIAQQCAVTFKLEMQINEAHGLLIRYAERTGKLDIMLRGNSAPDNLIGAGLYEVTNATANYLEKYAK